MTTIPVEAPAPEAPDMPDTPVLPPPDDADHIMPPLFDPYEDDTEWQAAKRAYHAHYCQCPDCAEAESRRKSSLPEHLRKTQQW